jgi:molecular chaperone HscC
VNGLLQVEATVLKTQQSFNLVIEGNPGLLSEAEIAQALQRLADLKIHPRDRLENRTLMARAERLYEQCRGDPREWLGAQILRFERALATQDDRTVKAARKELEQALDHIERQPVLDDER